MKTATRRFVAALAAVFLITFLCSCKTPEPGAPPAEETTIDQIVRIAKVLGDAAIRVEGTRVLKERGLLTLVDTNGDQQAELAEVLAYAGALEDPAAAIALYLIVAELVSKKGR